MLFYFHLCFCKTIQKNGKKTKERHYLFLISNCYYFSMIIRIILYKNFTIFNSVVKEKIFLYLHTLKGGLAQLARAFDWQSKGHRFDSGNLHKKKEFSRFLFFYALDLILNANGFINHR
jgi:hypothetical protein